MPKKAKKPRSSDPPSREQLLAFISGRGGDVNKRDLVRAFQLDAVGKRELNALLRELRDEGKLGRKRRRLHVAGELPAVVAAEITGRDEDGELIAVPAEWDEDEHGAAPKIRIEFGRRREPGPAPGIGDRVLLRTERNEPGDPVSHTGRVIKLLTKARAQALGIFREWPGGGGRLVPVDKKSLGREMAIPQGATGGAVDGDLVAVDLLSQRAFGLPTARVRERIGSIKSERAVSLIAIHAHGIPSVFRAETLAEAERAAPASMTKREDWTSLPLVTIDPPDAKDHDDAVFAAPDTDPANRGGFVVTVAIADVAYYVRPGSSLDREALERGNSVYFPDRVVPMLPERLSGDLCSLRPGERRPALAVRMAVGSDGRKRRHSFHRVMMRSHARLHYEQAQAAIEGNPDDRTGPILDPILQPLFNAYHVLAKGRDARQPLALDIPERKIVLGAHGLVERVVSPARLDAHKLVEEFMILANVAAAETCEQKRTLLLYRVHDAPAQEKVAALREFLQTLNIKLPQSSHLRPADFNNVLRRVAGTDNERLVHEVVLRTQAQAEYAAGNYGHYGLQLRRYAHFTSPIRRYADLIVHRALIRALGLGQENNSDGLPDTTPEALAEIGASISAAERRAMAAERETIDRLIAHFLADRVGATFRGRISGVTRAGLFVKLDDTGADGFIPARTLGGDYFRYEEAHHAMVGDRTGETHRLGDPVEVKLVEAIPAAGALRFELLSEGRYDRPVRGARSKREREPRRPAASRKKPPRRKGKR
ncbi:MAG: ribonuclease R [Bradyrhizobiaceae bacterium]|nr:ribonuclease R [Bradyrhizobiaceae bacterium]